MKQLYIFLLCMTSVTLSLVGENPPAETDLEEVQYGANNSNWVTVSVSTPADLTSAIQTAALRINNSTIIEITGTITGNFTVPATVNIIKLVGTGTNPTITANGTGTALSISLGATVKIENLTITGASGSSEYNIRSYGSLSLVDSQIIGAITDAGGLLSLGNLTVRRSSFSNNATYGIECQGIVFIKKSHINNNGSTGFYPYYGANVTLEGTTVNQNGDDGIYAYYGCSLILKNCHVNRNTGYGLENSYTANCLIENSSFNNNTSSGIYFEGGATTVTRSKINDNGEGGVYGEYGSMTINNSVLNGNLEYGGIYNDDDSIIYVYDSTISNNTTVEDDGAGFYNDGVALLSGCTLTNNTSVSGGAVYNGYLLTILNSTIQHNTATGNGGGVYNVADASLVVRDSLISFNNSQGNAGGVYNSGTATFINSKVNENTATTDGGGVANIIPGSLTLILSHVNRNTATSGGGIYNTGSLTVKNSNVVNNTPDQIFP